LDTSIDSRCCLGICAYCFFHWKHFSRCVVVLNILFGLDLLLYQKTQDRKRFLCFRWIVLCGSACPVWNYCFDCNTSTFCCKTLHTVQGYIGTVFFVGNIFLDWRIFLLIFCSVLIYFFAKKRKTEKDFFVFGGLCCAVLLILSGIIVSIAIRPLFVARYLVPVLGLVWLFFAVECGTISQKRIYIFLLIVLAPLGLISFWGSAHREIEEHRASSIFYAYVTEHKHQDDVFVFVHATGSRHLPFTMNQLFPDQTYTITATGERLDLSASALPLSLLAYRLWGNSYVEYTPDIYDDRTVWTFISGFNEGTQLDNVDPLALRGEYRGSFRWNRYRFRLYRSSPMACLY